MPTAAAQPIHIRAYQKHLAGQPLSMLEKVALQQLDLNASQAAGHPVTIDAYSGGANAQYQKIGNTVGNVLEKAAPLAVFIPGVGPIAAGAIAAGASAGGQALQGDRVNVGQALATGAGVGATKYLAGRQPVGTDSGKAGLESIGKAGTSSASGGGIGGLLGRVGDFITDDPGRAIKLGLGAYGAVQSARTQGRADDLTQRALAPLSGVNPFANLPVDEGNPYARQGRRTGQQVLRAELSR